MDASENEGGADLEALRREVAELRASRRRLVLAADGERRGFERALHDGLQQQLIGLAADLELLARSVESDPSAVSALAQMRDDLRDAVEQTRTLAHRIAPPLLEAGGLVVAMRSVAASADVTTRIDVDPAAPLPEEVAGAVYFCFVDVLEAATAGASVVVTVWEEDGSVAFEFAAEGDVDVGAIQLGDRIEALGGDLIVRSGPDGRTSWLGTLPLPR